MKIIATNKRATFDYNISLIFECGIILTGSEVKSLRVNSCSIKESHIEENIGELWLSNCFVKKYESSSDKENNPIRSRKLLLNKRELSKFLGSVKKEGFSIIPINMFFNDSGIVKINIGLGKGKKKYEAA